MKVRLDLTRVEVTPAAEVPFTVHYNLVLMQAQQEHIIPAQPADIAMVSEPTQKAFDHALQLLGEDMSRVVGAVSQAQDPLADSLDDLLDEPDALGDELGEAL